MKSYILPVAIILLTSVVFGQSQEKKILLEEFSTAPCGFCPDGDIIAEQLMADHPQVIWVTHHAGFGVDSMTVPESKSIAGAFTDFAPGACIDRGDHPIPVYTRPPFIAVSRQKWDSVCTAHLGDPPVVTIEIGNTFHPAAGTLSCTVAATFLAAPVSGDLRLNLYLVEDSVIGIGKGYDQTNYFDGTPGHPCYQKGDPIVGYSHRRVIRAVPSGAWGLSGVIPASPELKVYSHTFENIPVSPRWNPNAVDVVAFVSYYNEDAKKRTVLNTGSRRMLDGSTHVADRGAMPHAASLSLAPNPIVSSATMNAFVGSGQVGSVVLSDAVGRVIAEYTFHAGRTKLTIPTAGLQAGTYFCRLLTADGLSLTRAFIVLR